MYNGGVVGSRGYIFQAIVALIDCLMRTDWDAIKVEPTKQNKVDIQLYGNGELLSAVQVKSSINAFKKSDVQKYLDAAKNDAPDAKEVHVYLITDTYTASIKQFAQDELEVKEFPFEYLEDVCKGKLINYVDRVGLGRDITASNLILLYQTLFATIILNSKSSEPISRSVFETEFQRALPIQSRYTRDTYSEADVSKSETVSESEKNIKCYYDYVLKRYKKRNEGNILFGEESLEEVYMPSSYYKSKEEFGDVAQLFDEFISKGESGVLWIVGEPGHGTTSMCIKAVADHALKVRYRQASGVFWFRLSPHDAPEMVDKQKLILEKAFRWGLTDDTRDNTIDLHELKGGLVFLDGFDELKSTLEKYDISDNLFHTQVNQLAEKYKLHIVVTSRIRALELVENCTEEQLKNGTAEIKCVYKDGSSQKNAVKMLSPLTGEEQLAWINELIGLRKSKGKDTSDLERYIQTFRALQENEDIKGLLEIPILFRMIVQNCYEPSSDNRVDLYRELFDKTLLRQGKGDQRNRLHSIYREIAYRIFVYDDDSTELNKEEFEGITGNDAYLYEYHLHTPEAGQDKKNQYRIAFLHKSFYQYFLSEFFYEKFETIKDVQDGKDFLKYLWARRIDKYVLDNLRFRAKDVNAACKFVLSALEETDAILPDYDNEYASKEHIGNYDMANNVFWNAVSACNSLYNKENAQEPLDLTGRIAELLSKYDCFGILLRSSSLSYANMCSAYLIGADLHGAILNGALLLGANLRSADLSSTDLCDAYLIGANLRGTVLRNANLRDANMRSVVLRNADLRGADLRDIDLRGADLCDADLRNADLHDADLCDADLRGADLRGTDLHDADLSGTDLSSANLTGAYLISAKLLGTNLEKTQVSRDQYAYISIKDVKNLDKIIVVDDE